MFYDRSRIFVRSGDGGDGMISFRREKHVPRGGPDGGDGGNGGDIEFVVSDSLSSLVQYHRRTHYRAGDGEHGKNKRMTGARGQTLVLEVPAGTIIRDEESGELLADLIEPNESITLLHGGRGGRGNVRFTTSTNQAPRLAERGEPGQEKWLLLELKLIADVGIVGMPNAGKSTLLAAVSAARPKIADYPFTTLQPNLGVVEVDNHDTFVLADIPGLIEGASAGVGLGHEFLRHIERTRVIIHLLDGNAQDPWHDFEVVNTELDLYDPRLKDKPQIVALNKIDIPHAQERQSKIEALVRKAGYDFCVISAVTGQGVRQMIFRVKELLDEIPQETPVKESIKIIRPEPDAADYEIIQEDNGWRVRGEGIERVAAMTYWEFEPTVRRFQQILDNSGISEALRQSGIKDGDTVFIGDQELEWSE